MAREADRWIERQWLGKLARQTQARPDQRGVIGRESRVISCLWDAQGALQVKTEDGFVCPAQYMTVRTDGFGAGEVTPDKRASVPHLITAQNACLAHMTSLQATISRRGPGARTDFLEDQIKRLNEAIEALEVEIKANE